MGIINALRNIFKPDSKPVRYNLEQFPELTGLAERRRGMTSYMEWFNSSYAHEMRRRFEYYEANQVLCNPQTLRGTPYITPKLWKAAHSGSGWDDIRAMLPDATSNTIVKPMITNFTQIVVDNTGVVYSVPPKNREVMKGEALEEDATDILNRVYLSAEHDTKADQLCKWSGLFYTVFQQISYDEENERVVKTNLQPQDVFVIPDSSALLDLQHPNCFVAIRQDLDWVTKQHPDTQIIWQCWWQNYWWYETSECVPYKDLNLTTEGVNENPYKDELTGKTVKPLLVVHARLSGHIHDSGSDILVQQNQVFDRGFTAVTHTQEFQGFAIPVFSGTDVEEVEANPYGAAAPVILRDPQASLTFAHPAAPIGETQGVVIKEMRVAAQMHQIDPELVDQNAKIQSGVSRAQGRIALAERRTTEFPKWIPFERESYWITGTIWNYHNPGGKQFLAIRRFESPNIPVSESITILVQFGELAPIIDPLVDVTVNKMSLDLNLVDTADIIAAQRQIPKPRAQKIADDIRAKNKKERPGPLSSLSTTPRIGQSGNPPMNPDRPSDKTGGNMTSSSGNSVVGKGGK